MKAVGDVQKKIRTIQITFQPHALERMEARLPGVRKEQLRGRLRQRIQSELRKGTKVYYGAIRVEVVPGIWCVCAPDLAGWTVITVIDKAIPREVEKT